MLDRGCSTLLICPLTAVCFYLLVWRIPMRLLFAAAAAAVAPPELVSLQCQLLLALASVCFVYHRGEIKRQQSDFPVQHQRPHPALEAVEQTPRCMCGQPRREEEEANRVYRPADLHRDLSCQLSNRAPPRNFGVA